MALNPDLGSLRATLDALAGHGVIPGVGMALAAQRAALEQELIGAVTDEFNDYSVVDLFVGWRSSDYSWDVNVFAKNVFDEDETIQQLGPDQYDQEFSGGSYTRTSILDERTIGVMARYNF